MKIQFKKIVINNKKMLYKNNNYYKQQNNKVINIKNSNFLNNYLGITYKDNIKIM